MKKRDNKRTDLERCEYQIYELLREYNCKIEYDKDLLKVILYDVDTKKFADLT